MLNRSEEVKNYRKLVLAANKESIKKEAFKDLLNRLFAHHEETKRIVDVITSGAEKPILNIPRKDRLHRGSADTLYNKVIIEFENDLKKSLKHAKEQLAGYLLGQYKSGEGYDYVLIASDLIVWKVFSIDVSSLEKLNTLREDEVILNEVVTASFTLKDDNAEDFYFWIDRFLFKEEKIKAKLKNIEEAFGNQSLVFREAYLELQAYFDTVKDTGEVQVAYEQWKKTLSIAYDNFNDKTDNFGHKQIKLHSAEDLRDKGFLHTSRWFNKTEKLWDENKTEKSKDMSTNDRLNFQYGVTEQNLNDNYLVLYNSSAKDANATIVKRKDENFEFVVDHKTYMFFTSNLKEAYYLTAILNSTAPNEMMKDFQSRGLFGARDIHKKILDIYYPRFDATDKTHLALAELSETAHAKAKEYLEANPPTQNLTPTRLGRLRLDIKRHLTDEMREIDNLVEKLIG